MGAKIKDEIWNEIITFIEEGLSQRQAYELAGISKFPYYEKLKNDNNYYNKIKRAQQSFKQKHLENITTHSQKDWHASAWLLERTNPDEFAKVEKVESKEVDEFAGYKDNELDEEIKKLEEGTKDKKDKVIARKAKEISEN